MPNLFATEAQIFLSRDGWWHCRVLSVPHDLVANIDARVKRLADTRHRTRAAAIRAARTHYATIVE